MPATNLAELEALLAAATSALPQVTTKKMFGCPAYWARENVFALVWKHGRIGFKLPEEKSYQALLGASGAEPWKAGPMTMAHWVLVPESFHGKPAELKKWAAKAHAQCAKLVKQAPKKPTAKLAAKLGAKLATKKKKAKK